MLYKTFRDRLEEVFDQAQHASSIPGEFDGGHHIGGSRPVAQQPMDDKAADFVAGMDDWEKQCQSEFLFMAPKLKLTFKISVHGR